MAERRSTALRAKAALAVAPNEKGVLVGTPEAVVALGFARTLDDAASDIEAMP